MRSGESPGLRTFLVTVAALLQQWRLVVSIPLGCMVLAVVLVLVIRPTYRAVTTFIVDSETTPLQGAGGFASLATQFGFQLPSGGQSPQFFLNGDPQTDGRINMGAFTVPGVNQIGPYPRFYLRNPGIHNQDFSLFKNVPIAGWQDIRAASAGGVQRVQSPAVFGVQPGDECGERRRADGECGFQ